MLLAELLNKLSKKAGIALDDKDLVAILAIKEIAMTDVPDVIANKIDTSLMDINAAKAHPEFAEAVKKNKGEVLGKTDSLIHKMLTEMGYSDEEVADIKADTNTLSKVEKAVKRVKDLEAKKAGASAPDKVALQKQIDELNGKIRDTTTANETTINTLKATHNDQLTSYQLKAMLAAKKLALPDTMSDAMKQDIALTAVKSDLTAKGFQIVNTNGALEIKRNDGTDAYDQSNQKVDLTKFIEGALAQNSLLAVTETTPPIQQTQTIPGTQTFTPNQAALAQIDAQIAAAGNV